MTKYRVEKGLALFLPISLFLAAGSSGVYGAATKVPALPPAHFQQALSDHLRLFADAPLLDGLTQLHAVRTGAPTRDNAAATLLGLLVNPKTLLLPLDSEMRDAWAKEVGAENLKAIEHTAAALHEAAKHDAKLHRMMGRIEEEARLLAAQAGIRQLQEDIDQQKQQIIQNGGFTPEVLLAIAPASTLSFNDGASFIVENPKHFVSGFVRFDILSTNRLIPMPPESKAELIVAGYSGYDPGLQLLSVPTETRRGDLQFIGENLNELEKILPMRRFLRFANDGMYAIAERLPDYKGKPMTVQRFFRDPELSRNDREMLGNALETFLRETLDVRFTDLHLPKALAFDSRDGRWKFLIVSSCLRRFWGDSPVTALMSNLEYTSLGDESFFKAFYHRLVRIRDDIADSAHQRSIEAKKRQSSEPENS